MSSLILTNVSDRVLQQYITKHKTIATENKQVKKKNKTYRTTTTKKKNANKELSGWYSKGWIKVISNSTFGKGVVATKDLPLNKKTLAFVSYICGQPFDAIDAENVSADKAKYLITLSKNNVLNLESHWCGAINHAPLSRANIQLIEDEIHQIKPIRKGEELRYDYGLDYWIFQLSHVPIEEWSKEDIAIWKNIHRRVDNYQHFLELQLWNKHPLEVMHILKTFCDCD